MSFDLLKPGVQLFAAPGAQVAIDYQCASEQPTHLLVLINGYQRPHLDFRAFRRRLAQLVPHVATVALDNRFCGQTLVHDRASALTVADMAADVYAVAGAFRQALGLHAVSLLGISMGGMIAQSVAGLYSADLPLENLFLVSTTPGGAARVWPPGLDASVMNDVPANFEDLKQHMSCYFGASFLKKSPLMLPVLCKNMLESFQAPDYPQNAFQQRRAANLFDSTAFLGFIRAQRVLILSGDEDQVIPPANARFLQEHLPGSHLVTYPAGHLLLLEEAEAFATQVGAVFL